jgi:O-antigen ligase
VKTGSLFVLKYIEYFIVFFMVINHVKDEEQVKRFIFCLFLTCFITAIIGILQIPGGDRVSAPFEGETSEPNTFGGYLLFIGCIAAGILSKTQNHKIKKLLIFFIIVMILPFLFTQSRSSYLALIPACMTIGFMVKRRIIILGLIIISISLSPLFLPAPVKNRILYTFTQPEGSGQVTIGDIRLDTSTSARLVSWREALKDWFKQPILGYGVTGYTFVDAQYPRVLTETGILGFIAFMYLLFSIFKLAVNTLRNVTTPHFKGLCIGFMAGYIGLLVHALAANTFIIVRIMEPFWFFVGIVAVLPALERQRVTQVQTDEVPRRKLVEVS